MTQRVLGPSRSKRRKTRLLALTILTASAFAVLFVAASSGTLSGGSTFESGDGNLAVDTAGLHDWNSPVEAISCGTVIPGGGDNCGLDLVKGDPNASSDNSFGQGSKNDTPSPTVVSGQIPPSKDDLSRFYVNQEKAGGNDYLYLAWERSNLLGSAHVDFEFNQSQTLSTNGVTPVRTAGDLLIDFDFSGSGNPVLVRHSWITTGSAADCEANNALPCWNKAVPLGANAESAVNSVPVVDTNPPGNPRTLDGNTKNGINSTFGEAGINLTDSGVFTPGVCQHFGSAYLKSRSSGNSFTSELKDFIAPIPVNISNCGQIIIKKVTIPSPDPTDTSFSYLLDDGALTNAGVPKNFSLKNGQSNATTVFAGNSYSAAETLPAGWTLVSATCDNGSGSLSGTTLSSISVAADTDTTCTFTNQAKGTIIVEKITDDGSGAFVFTSGTLSPSPFTLTTSAAGVAGKASRTFGDLGPGTYDVAETVPAGWNLVSSTCDDGSAPGSIGLSPGETVTCTFHDARERGAILVTKTRKHAATPTNDVHEGVTFTVTGGGLPAAGLTGVTNASGQICFSNLVLSSFVGDYTVTETVPAGYHSDDAEKTVSVTTESAGCGASDSPATVSFHNTPLTDITVSVNSHVDGGTASTIDCGDAGDPVSTGANGDGSKNKLNLEPGTYTCVVLVDP